MAAPATRPAALRARIRRCRLAHLCSRPATLADEGRSRMRRCIGLDVHREFAQVAIWEDGVVWQAGRIQTTPEALRLFADSLCVSDEVALEATCNTHAIARLLERQVGRVVVSNPMKTRAIAEAKVKTDKVDAQVLAEGPWETWRLRCQAPSWRKEMLLRCRDRGSTPMSCASGLFVLCSSRSVRSLTSPRIWACTRSRC